MRWGTYFAVCAAVISIGLALGVTMPLVSLRLESWGYDSFAIGVMAATPAVGVLLGASLAGRLAARFGTTVLMQLCLLLGALSVAGLALVAWTAAGAHGGEVLRWSVDWLPTLGLKFGFRMDGLAWLFTLLITGIGALVVLYAC